MTTKHASATGAPQHHHYEALAHLVHFAEDEVPHLSTAERIVRLEIIRRTAACAYIEADPALEEAISALVLRACNTFIQADLPTSHEGLAERLCSA